MKKIFLSVALILTGTTTFARHISEREAMNRALEYMYNGSVQQSGLMACAARDVVMRAEPAYVEAESVYAFNLKNGGYIIASADSRTLPVLGYSSNGRIDWEQMPENMREWLKSYDEAIATLGDRTDYEDGNRIAGIKLNSSDARAGRVPVEPLIKTSWYAYEPYWNQSPLYDGDDPDMKGKRCIVGCGAIALAQILNYWQWPKSLPDGLPAYDYDTEYNGVVKTVHIDSLQPVEFDWDNMLDNYHSWNYEEQRFDLIGTEAQQTAVATLMRYSSQAIKSSYTPFGTGSLSNDVQEELVGRLGYPASTYIWRRQNVGIDEWENLIYGELASNRPVYYCGARPGYSHAFICDGYDGNGLFHINWGWGGSYDGYFSLSVLNADYYSANVDNVSATTGFTRNQRAFVFVDPSMEIQPFPLAVSDQSLEIYVDNNIVEYCFYYNESTHDKTACIALGTMDDDGLLTPVFYGAEDDSLLFTGNILNSINIEIDTAFFQPGDSLSLFPMIRIMEPESEWRLVGPKSCHVVAGRTDDGLFFINVYNYRWNMECTDVSVSHGSLNLEELCNVTFTIRNLDSKDYSDDFFVVPFYFGHITESDITYDTPYWCDDAIRCGSFIRAGQEGEVTVPLTPPIGGLMRFHVYTRLGQLIDCPLSLSVNDTLHDYSPYLDNNSYVAQENGQWVFNVEFCDKAGVEVPQWIPSEKMYLEIAHKYVGTKIAYVEVDIQEYLKGLPEHGGNGNYRFSYKFPLTQADHEGDYYVASYLMEWKDDTFTSYYLFNFKTITFHVDDTTGVNELHSESDSGVYYDLLGRRIEGMPKTPGVYLKNNKKVTQ